MPRRTVPPPPPEVFRGPGDTDVYPVLGPLGPMRPLQVGQVMSPQQADPQVPPPMPRRRRYPCIFCNVENPDHSGRDCPVRLARERESAGIQQGQPATVPVGTQQTSAIPVPYPNHQFPVGFQPPTETVDSILMAGGVRKLYAVYFPQSAKGLYLVAWGALKVKIGNHMRGKRFEQLAPARAWLKDHGDVAEAEGPVYFL